MYSATMKPCCMVLTVLMFFCRCSEGFVVVGGPGQPRSRLMTGSSRRDMMRGAPSSSSASPLTRRRNGSRRSRRTNGGASSGGVGSLRAGVEMPGLEIIAGFLDGPAASLLEQSARHHYPSAFIGGTVGVLGTLTAIQVRSVCVRVYIA